MSSQFCQQLIITPDWTSGHAESNTSTTFYNVAKLIIRLTTTEISLLLLLIVHSFLVTNRLNTVNRMLIEKYTKYKNKNNKK